MNLSIVIPFYNEEANVHKVVGGLVELFEKSAIDYELILVNNGSKDKTPQILEELAGEKPQRIKTVQVPINQGYGWGVINGLKVTAGDYTCIMSGDGQTRPEDALKIYECLLSEKCDLVKAKRAVRRDRAIRKILSFSFNSLFALAFNVRTMDINGSPKIFKKEYLPIFNLVSKDWFLDAEIMIKAKYLNLYSKEVSVEFLHREKGKSNVRWSTIFEFLGNMYEYRMGKGIREWKRAALK
jgi:dolichol-phosphate mannosyltransferase